MATSKVTGAAGLGSSSSDSGGDGIGGRLGGGGGRNTGGRGTHLSTEAKRLAFPRFDGV
jgi:hypothetical protein